MKMTTLKLFLCVLVGSAHVSLLHAARQQNPIEKIVSLLTKLQGQVVEDGEVEAVAYEKYKTYCQDSTFQKNQEIKTGKSKKEDLEATISKATSDMKTSTGRIEEVSAAIAENDAKLKKATGVREADAATFKAAETELMQAIDMVGKAVDILEKEMAKTNSTSLLQTSETTEQLQKVIMGLGAVVDGASLGASEDVKKLTAMLQVTQQSEENSDDSEDPKPYEGQSGGVIQVLEDLRDKAQDQLREIRQAETEAINNYDLVKQAITEETSQYQKELDDEKAALADAKKTKATADGNLAMTTKELSTDMEDYEKLQHDCMRKAADHETTVAGRAKELDTLTKAKKLIQDQMGGTSDLQMDESFLQLASSSRTRRSRVQVVGQHVVTLVQTLALKFNSASLKQAASRISAVIKFNRVGSGEDPFAKVKGILSDMIAKLEREQVADMREKDYCDREMKRTESKQNDLKDDVAKLKSEIDQAASASTKLKSEVKELQAELATLLKLSKDMGEAREAGHKSYLKDKSDMEAGLNSIRASIHVLRDYYAQDKDEDASLLQVQSGDTDSESNLEGDDQPSPPENHERSTSAGMGIIGLLEVVESDLAKNLAQLQTEEDDLQQNFEVETQQYQVTKHVKEQDIALKTKEFTGLDKRVSQLSQDHASDTEELAAVTEYFAKVKDRCVAKPVSYTERKEKREEEIRGLQETLSILQSQGSTFLQKSRR